jgi:hypothetical protein
VIDQALFFGAATAITGRDPGVTGGIAASGRSVARLVFPDRGP